MACKTTWTVICGKCSRNLKRENTIDSMYEVTNFARELPPLANFCNIPWLKEEKLKIVCSFFYMFQILENLLYQMHQSISEKSCTYKTKQ